MEKSAHLYAVNFFAKNFCILNGSAHLHAVIFFHKNTALLDGFPAGAFVCKRLRPFFFLREKRNKKTRPLPPQQGGGLALVPAFENSQGAGSIFLKKPLKKISTFKPLQTFILSDFS